MKRTLLCLTVCLLVITSNALESLVTAQNSVEETPLYTGGPPLFRVEEELVVIADIFNWESTTFDILNMMDSSHIISESYPTICGQQNATWIRCTFKWGGISYGVHVIAVYVKERTGQKYLLDRPLTIKVDKASQPRQRLPPLGEKAPGHKVGIYYTTLNQPDTSVAIETSKFLKKTLTMEDVLLSNGVLSYQDIDVSLWQKKLNISFPFSLYGGNWYQHLPQLGLYCLYTKRPGEKGIMPDCPNITETLTMHANWLVSAGIDFIVFDATNWGHWYDPESDVRQMRPTEIIFEEWKKLRDQGIKTPQIVVWNCIRDNENMWQAYLDRIYNNPLYDDLILRQPETDMKVFMVVFDPERINMTSVAALIDNGGRRDIIAIYNWISTGYDPAWYNEGIWTYLSPCVTEVNNTHMWTNNIHPNVSCNHQATIGSPLGSCWTVSAETALCNVPFGSPGKLHGLYMKKQFQDVFARPLDNIFMPSWNEFHISPMSFDGWDIHNPYFHSMGAEGDSEGQHFFIDGYGCHRSRTIEPSVHDKGRYYNILQSCLRVARLLRIWGGDTCDVSEEECCKYHQDEYYSNVWSMEKIDGSDTLITTNKDEVNKLRSSGDWHEVCNPWPGTTDFCANPQAPWQPVVNYDVIRGPFLIYTFQIDNTTALYRCNTKEGFHFFSTHPNCEALGTAEFQLGYISTQKSSATPRSLHRCFKISNKSYYHTADGPCKSGDQNHGVFGFIV